jgi:uncharacterized protein (TIGR02996 family)
MAARKPTTASSAITGELERSLTAVRAGELEDALQGLLAAWQAVPAAELATAIEHVGAQVDRTRPALPQAKAGLAGWLEVASRRDHADVGRLLAALPDQFLRLRPRLDALAEIPRDPRISTAILALEIGTSSQSSGPLYTTIFAMLAKIGDGRALPILKKRLPWYRTELDSTLRDRIATRVEKLLGTLAPPPALDARDRELVDAIVEAKREAAPTAKPRAKPTAARPDEALLAAVFANPADDAPRAVYADALLERGDPRGELVALQLASHGRVPTDVEDRRISALLREHARAWSAPLDSVVAPDTIRFARGFLDSCVVKQSAAKLVGHPMWSTVRELECHELDVIVHPMMRALRRVSLSARELSELARRDTPVTFDTAIGRWLSGRASTWHGIEAKPGDWRDALAVGALRNLTGLSLDASLHRQGWTHLPGSKLAAQLERLDISLYGWSRDCGVAEWIPLAKALPRVKRLIVRQQYEGKRVIAALERTRDGWDAVLQVNHYDLASHVEFLLDKRVPEVARVRVEYVGKDRHVPAKLQPIVDVIARRVDTVTINDARTRVAEI